MGKEQCIFYAELFKPRDLESHKSTYASAVECSFYAQLYQQSYIRAHEGQCAVSFETNQLIECSLCDQSIRQINFEEHQKKCSGGARRSCRYCGKSYSYIKEHENTCRL
jgi:hypothetical protein